MSALPFFTLIAPSTQASSTGPLSPPTMSSGAGSGSISPDFSVTSTTPDTENSISFWQQLQTATETTPVFVGQELAAFVQPINLNPQVEMPIEATLPEPTMATVETSKIAVTSIGDMESVADITEHATFYVNLETMPIADDQETGLQYLERLRQAQPHVQIQTAVTAEASTSVLQKTDSAAIQPNLVEQKTEFLSPLRQRVATESVSSQAQTAIDLAAQGTREPQMQNSIAGLVSDKKINLDQLGFEPVEEGISLDDLEINLDEIELNQAKSETKSIHEKPLTLATSKETTIQTAVAQTDANVLQETKGLSSDMTIAVSKDPQISTKSMALEQPQVSQSQTSEQTKGTFNKLDVPPQHPQWNDQVAKRISIMAGEGIQTARIQLDPPELGSLEVKVKVQNDQVSVSFGSNNQIVRDALEAQSPRLRELLEQQGVNLTDVNVSEQGRQQGEQPGEGGFTGSEEGSNVGLEELEEQEGMVTLESDSLIDYFA